MRFLGKKTTFGQSERVALPNVIQLRNCNPAPKILRGAFPFLSFSSEAKNLKNGNACSRMTGGGIAIS